MPTAVIAAAVGGAGAIGGAMINKSATNKATKAAERAAAENARIQQQQYQQTRSDLQPYTQAGYAGTGGILDYYGLGGNGGAGTAATPGQPDYNAYIAANPDIAAYMQANPQDVAAQGGPEAYAAAHYQAYGQTEGRPMPTTGGAPATEAGGGYTGPTFDPTGPARPDTGERPTDYGAAPSFSSFYDPNPTQQYRDELARTTRALNGAAGMGGTYFSGNRGLKLQENADRLFRADEQNRFNRANTLYQTALGQYNTNRDFANTNYNVDKTFSNAAFDADRNYTTGRIDSRTNDLFKLTQIGANATGALAGAGQNYANASTANNNNLASITGNAALAGAANTNNLIGQGIQAIGLWGGGGNANTLANKPYNSGWKI